MGSHKLNLESSHSFYLFFEIYHIDSDPSWTL